MSPFAKCSAAVLVLGAMSLSFGIVPVGAASPAPPSATTGSVTSVRPVSAVVTGSVNPHGAATTWYFQYGLATDTGYGSRTPDASAGSGAIGISVSVSLAGLEPATSYHYRIVASSSSGTSYGGDGIFNTSSTPNVVTGAATDLTSGSATLNGMVFPEALATSWYFEYGPSTTYGSKTPAGHLLASPNDTNVSARITDLAARSTYYFRLVATSSAGTSIGIGFILVTGRSVTLNTSESTVVYGAGVNLSGAVANGRSGVQVTIESEQFNQKVFSGIAALTTGSNGSWSYTAHPNVRTTFEAEANGGTSSPVVISVRPVVYLSITASGNISTRVLGAVSFGFHVLQLQRLSDGLWVTWKHVRLDSSSRSIFSTSLPKGRTAIRMAIGPYVIGINQAAPGYLAGISREMSYYHR